MNNYKVCKIVSEYLIVVNYGLSDNARAGDILEVVQTGDEVKDPETNESLGTLDIHKGTLKVMNVYAKMSLCKSNETFAKIVPKSTLQSFTSTLSTLSASLSEAKALNVNTKQITGGYQEGNKQTINIGDPVFILRSRYVDEQETKEIDGE